MDDDAVWSRVFAPSPGTRWEERLLWESRDLAEDLAAAPSLRREQQEISALLRGIRQLEGAKGLPMPPRPRRKRDLVQCWSDSLSLAREFAARAADAGTGLLWQAAADRQLDQCVRIALALGR